MAESKAQTRAVRNMRRAAETMSEMLARTVTEARRLQKEQEKAQGRPFRTKEELAQNYDTKTMKELTAILKDITAVVKALEDDRAESGTGTGVVLLPPVALPDTPGAADTESADTAGESRSGTA